MTVALIYNWWSLFVRLANPAARMEAIISRPFLLSGIARKTTHAGQQHLKITPLQGKGEQAKVMLTRVSQLLHEWKKATGMSAPCRLRNRFQLAWPTSKHGFTG